MKKHFLERFFSLTTDGTDKILTIFGIRIKFRRKHKERLLALKNRLNVLGDRLNRLSEEIGYHNYQINNVRNVLGYVTPPAYMQYFEVHVTDHCNLNCKGCAHYCPLVTKPVFHDIDKFSADFRELSSKLTVERIRLLGGEPLLHPDVNRFIAIARRYFPYSEIHLVTNGILLPTMKKGFWETLQGNEVFLDISQYPPLKDKQELYKQLAAENNVKLSSGILTNKFWCSLNSKGDSDANESYRQCLSMKNCPNLRNGRMMVCPEACYLDIYNEYFNEKIPFDKGIDIYKHSGEEIVRYLKSPSEACNYCIPCGRNFEWGMSMKDKSEWDVHVRV